MPLIKSTQGRPIRKATMKRWPHREPDPSAAYRRPLLRMGGQASLVCFDALGGLACRPQLETFALVVSSDWLWVWVLWGDVGWAEGVGLRPLPACSAQPAPHSSRSSCPHPPPKFGISTIHLGLLRNRRQ